MRGRWCALTTHSALISYRGAKHQSAGRRTMLHEGDGRCEAPIKRCAVTVLLLHGIADPMFKPNSRTLVLKEMVRAVVPGSMIAFALEAREVYRFAVTPRMAFDPTALRAQATVDLSAILQDGGVDAAWAIDHVEIAESFGRDDRFGGVNPGDRRALYYLIRALRPRRVLEVGTHIGASTLYIARALRANGEGSVVTVDITDVNDSVLGAWRSVGQRMSPRSFAQELGCSDRITFVVSTSQQFLATSAESFDLIFLDGDHAAHTVYGEISRSLVALSASGTIVLHDFYPNGKALYPRDRAILGPYRALARIEREEPRLVVRPLGALPWETKQGTRETSLALIMRR